MKLLIFIVIALFLYYWLRDIKRKAFESKKGDISYQSPDEFKSPGNISKDITRQTRIIAENEKSDDM